MENKMILKPGEYTILQNKKPSPEIMEISDFSSGVVKKKMPKKKKEEVKDDLICNLCQKKLRYLSK